jgi:hypothetical protein
VGNDIDEATVAIVGGDGEGSAREFVVVTGPNFTPDYNDIETFVNGVNQGTSLTDAGTIRMREMRARDDFGFGVRQTTGFRYGRDFVIGGVLGDLVPVTYYEAQVVKKIRGAHVGVSAASGSQSNEQITLDLVNLPGG